MRIGIIGAGAVAGLHAEAARRIAGIELTAVCDINEEAAGAVAQPHGARVFADYRLLLHSGLVDAVIVNTPHGLHAEMVVAAAECGLDVLVEKPMATSLDQCDAMQRACDAAGVLLMVGQIQHFLPEKRAMAEVLESGVLGRVEMIHDYRSTDYRPGTRSQWFFDPHMAGGGAFMNIGGHCLDRCLWFGGAEAVSVRASMLHRFGSPVETDGLITVRLANGVGASISIASDTPAKVDELMVVCERGVVAADPRSGTYLRRDGVTTVLHEHDRSDIQTGFELQLRDFYRATRGAQSSVDNALARHIVEVVKAAYESADSGADVLLAGHATQPAVS